mmetsp:Transcript_5120/g.13152  ORF Transcript_5120/g.13152 Transcript_5120/m.13152 type:complete len:133 (+) Transcript_5120:212-610(+)
MADRQRVQSGAPWEAQVGYCRAVRVGAHVHVAGTTGKGDTAEAQTRAIFSTIEGALAELGLSLADVVRTRMYVVDIDSDWEAIGRVHGEKLGSVRPAATMVQVSRLIEPWMRVEIEVDAVASPAAAAVDRSG